MATFEEASHCPKCGEPGKPASVKQLDHGKGKIHYFVCENQRCRWYRHGTWAVQRRPDGSVPERSPGEKQFNPLTLGERMAAQKVLDAIKEEEKRPTGPGTWDPNR